MVLKSPTIPLTVWLSNLIKDGGNSIEEGNVSDVSRCHGLKCTKYGILDSLFMEVPN